MTTSRMMRPLAGAALAALVALTLLGCTSSGDGGTGATDDFLMGGATYTSDPMPPAGSAQVFLSEATSLRGELCLDVETRFVQDLFAVAFALRYDATVLRFRDVSAGPFLGSGNEILGVQATANEDGGVGILTVGLTRNSDEVGLTGVDGCSTGCGGAANRGALMTLCFDLVGAAEGSPIVFTGTLAGFDPFGTDPGNVVVPASGFVGGVVSVQ